MRHSQQQLRWDTLTSGIHARKHNMSVEKQRHDRQCNKYTKIRQKRFYGNCPTQQTIHITLMLRAIEALVTWHSQTESNQRCMCRNTWHTCSVTASHCQLQAGNKLRTELNASCCITFQVSVNATSHDARQHSFRRSTISWNVGRFSLLKQKII